MVIPVINVKNKFSRNNFKSQTAKNLFVVDTTSQAYTETSNNLHQQQQSSSTANDTELWKYISNRNTLSKTIKNRYTSEPYLPQTQSSMKKSKPQRANIRDFVVNENYEPPKMPKSARKNNNSSALGSFQRQLIYSKHIDTLTAELMAAFSKDYNESLFDNNSTGLTTNEIAENRRNIPNLLANDDDEYIEVYDDLAPPDLSNDCARDFDDLSFDDEDEENDGEKDNDSDDGYEQLFYNANSSRVANVGLEHFDYEDDRLILATNIKERDFSRDNIVMKICNEIRSDLSRNKKLSKKLRRRLRQLELFEFNKEKNVQFENEKVIF